MRCVPKPSTTRASPPASARMRALACARYCGAVRWRAPAGARRDRRVWAEHQRGDANAPRAAQVTLPRDLRYSLSTAHFGWPPACPPMQRSNSGMHACRVVPGFTDGLLRRALRAAKRKAKRSDAALDHEAPTTGFVYVFACAYVCACAHAHVRVSVCGCVGVCVCARGVCVHTCVCVRVFVRAYVRTCVRDCARTPMGCHDVVACDNAQSSGYTYYIHAHGETYVRLHGCACACACARRFRRRRRRAATR
jgi:hypothetical protein